MDGSLDREVLDRHADVGQLAGIALPLVAQGVVLGGGDDGGRESGQFVGARRRDTSIPDIQEAAGVSASQIYHYFGDKQGLVLAVIDHQTDAKLAQQRPLLDNLDSIEALREWCDRAGDRQDAMGCEGGCEIGSLASELTDSDQSARTGLVAAFDRWEGPIRSGLARMQARGELSESADTAALATALLAAIQGGMLLSQVRRSSTAYRQAVSAVIDHIESHLVR